MQYNLLFNLCPQSLAAPLGRMGG